MGIEKLKAEFEQLKYIKEKLEYLNFDEQLGCYVEKNNGMPVGLAAWVNGAFYGFEQAAKADAVPDGFVVVPREPTERMIDAGVEETSVDWKRLVFGYKAMIEAQEPTND